MANNNNIDLLTQFLVDDDLEIVLIVYGYWRSISSHLNLWQLRKRITLQQIVEERRIGIVDYIYEIIPMYHNVQFHEHFRMRRATFEVY